MKLSLQNARSYLAKAEDRADLALVGMASLLPKAARLSDQSLADLLRLQVGAWRGHATRLNAIFAHLAEVRAVALSADGKTALTGSEDNTARLWEVVTGNGHSPEHACLLDRERGVLLAGDQVLPRISSNVSLGVSEPEGDPLGDWLASIAKLRGLPDDLLVLPGHGEPFTGLHVRLDQLDAEHAERLDAVAAFLVEPRRAVDCFAQLFRRPIGPDVLGMATGVVVGTSLFQTLFVTALATLIHALTTQAVDIVLAGLLLLGSVTGAQVGARLASRVRPEYLRLALAVIVLLVGTRILLGLVWRPEAIFSVEPQ